jgi:hypothetical protein
MVDATVEMMVLSIGHDREALQLHQGSGIQRGK